MGIAGKKIGINKATIAGRGQMIEGK